MAPQPRSKPRRDPYPTSISIPLELLERFEEHCEELEYNRNALIVRLIKEELERTRRNPDHRTGFMVDLG